MSTHTETTPAIKVEAMIEGVQVYVGPFTVKPPSILPEEEARRWCDEMDADSLRALVREVLGDALSGLGDNQVEVYPNGYHRDRQWCDVRPDACMVQFNEHDVVIEDMETVEVAM